MEKSKSKRQPKNFLRYFVDEFFLVRRDFDFQTSLSPDDCVMRIRAMGHEASGCNNYARMATDAYLTEEQENYVFQIEVFWKMRGGPQKTIVAEGEISSEGAYTHVSGTIAQVAMVSISRWLLLLLIMVTPFITLFFAWLNQRDFGSISGIFFLFPVCIAAMFYGWVTIENDRKNVFKIIQRLKLELKEEGQSTLS